MWQTFRCNHCVGHRRFAHIHKKKRSLDQVLKMVREYVLTKAPYQEIDEFDGKPRMVYQRVSKELIAVELKVTTHLVEQALQALNREGLVSQPRHTIPHDSKREPGLFWGGSDSSWQCDSYTVCGSFWK